ncbi:MAG: polysaccharide biosynthesis/export family protein [Acidobacteria bacterium]|nr:polysaccharide biosynthesis/export family protein [Acidobacteriota bacterium]
MRSLATKLCWISLVLVMAWGSVLAQTDKATQPTPTKPDRASQLPTTPVIDPRNKGVLIQASEDYRVSPGDMLDIQIEDAPELSKIYRVNASGSFSFPPFGSINSQGLTAEMLAEQIEKRLREDDYLKTPQVTVIVRQYNSQTFYVHGEVRQPGVYQIEGRPVLLKLISMAGGFTEKRGGTIYLLQPDREKKATEGSAAPSLATAKPESLNTTQTFSSTEKVTTDGEAQSDYVLNKIKISDMLKGDPKYNPRVEPDAVIYIPEADVFYVGGEVNSPGSFTIKEAATLRQAMSLAKGPTTKANPSKGIIFREKPGTTQRDEIAVNIDDVMKGKTPDIVLQPNDVIVLPDSKIKSITSAFINGLPAGAAVTLGNLPYIFR